ncbi:MAG: ATP-binding cassette domain-containing protein [Actinomycetota bacterium]|jgi:phospholipid/cholesterol/gamma-HCH transport system ATP-binding protein|nr:ATP-binding cassette domain-containing protein [Actinomycetota bacterium]
MTSTICNTAPMSREDGPRSKTSALREWVAPGEPIISLRGVTKSFGSHTVLEDVTFDIPKGRITSILGPSGTGKSVLLKNILGLLRPDRGEIWVDGQQIVGMRERKLYEIRRKFGVLFQDGALFGSMSLYDNIAFPLREHTHKNEREIREIVLRNAELVGLLDHLKKLPGEVSGGMKKRAGLARAMVTEPEIVLFDEPDSGLDPVRVAYLDELVVTAQRETGATFFIITHNISSVMRTADFMGVLFRSRLVKFATKEQMCASDDPIIRQFLAGRADGPIGMDEMAESTDWDGAPDRPAAGRPGGGHTATVRPASGTAAPHLGPPDAGTTGSGPVGGGPALGNPMGERRSAPARPDAPGAARRPAAPTSTLAPVTRPLPRTGDGPVLVIHPDGHGEWANVPPPPWGGGARSDGTLRR